VPNLDCVDIKTCGACGELEVAERKWRVRGFEAHNYRLVTLNIQESRQMKAKPRINIGPESILKGLARNSRHWVESKPNDNGARLCQYSNI
jgi:hypothetical protein